MQINLTTTKINPNFSKNTVKNGKVQLEKGKATVIETQTPYSGYATTENKNGSVFLHYNNGLLVEASSYQPAGIVFGEPVTQKVVRKYQRNNDTNSTEITTNHYNPFVVHNYATKYTTQTLYSNGKLKSKETRQNGEIDIKTFHPNGQLETSIHAHRKDEIDCLDYAYFYDKKGRLTKKILPYRNSNDNKIIQNEYNKNGIIKKSTKAIYTTDKTPKAAMPVGDLGQLIPLEITYFDKKGNFESKTKLYNA